MISKEEFRKTVETVMKNSGKNQEELATGMGYGYNYISEMFTPSSKLSPKFIKLFETFYSHFLENPTTGRGLKIVAAPSAIPFYDIETIGGKEFGADMTGITHENGTIDVGDLLRDSKMAMRVYGNSMIPGYPPGCVIGMVEKSNFIIQPGHTYVIETTDDRLLKRLYYSKVRTCFTAYSDNVVQFDVGPKKGEYCYPPFDIEKKDIKRLYDVTGVIKRNKNTIIVN